MKNGTDVKNHYLLCIHYEIMLSASNVVFVSLNPSVAAISFDYSFGFENLYYKITPYSAGTTYVYCKTEDGAVISKRIKVVVKKNIVESIKLNKKSLTLKPGGTYTLTGKISPENPRNPELEWKSSKSSVVTVDSDGVITAVGTGTAKVTAESSTGVKATCTVTVKAPKKKAKKSTKTSKSVPQGTVCWIPRTGKKYHSKSTCSNMKNPTKTTTSAAKSMGYTKCSKCW